MLFKCEHTKHMSIAVIRTSIFRYSLQCQHEYCMTVFHQWQIRRIGADKSDVVHLQTTCILHYLSYSGNPLPIIINKWFIIIKTTSVGGMEDGSKDSDMHTMSLCVYESTHQRDLITLVLVVSIIVRYSPALRSLQIGLMVF